MIVELPKTKFKPVKKEIKKEIKKEYNKDDKKILLQKLLDKDLKQGRINFKSNPLEFTNHKKPVKKEKIEVDILSNKIESLTINKTQTPPPTPLLKHIQLDKVEENEIKKNVLQRINNYKK
jgi:hypothetical protein